MPRTGPKSPAGKAIVATNAIRHGVFAKIPVVPNLERQADWDAHREGVHGSLDPKTHLEYALAERVAILLWRLHRVARYEAESVRLSQERAETDAAHSAWVRTDRRPPPRAELAAVVDVLRNASTTLALLDELAVDAPLDPVQAGHLAATLIGGEPSRASLPADLSASAKRAALWTVADLRQFLAALAQLRAVEVEDLLGDALDGLDEQSTRAESQLAEIDRQLDRSRHSRLLTDSDNIDKVVRYEAHLTRQLNSTLHELEALQARRQGQPTPLARVELSAVM
jgi:hypothetical protein